MTTLKTPVDPRLAPMFALRELMPLPAHDTEERTERKILRHADLKEAIDGPR
jgi:hypothetical protein